MCGIAGLLSNRKVEPEVLRRMTRAIARRGPDGEGVWVDSDSCIGLGHRRLAILELSPLGAQPMGSRSGRWILSFNGEIYNHHELRRELERSGGAPAWRGGSDTETLLECIAAWGFKETLRRSVGMFAISLWDRRERELHLARDRFGEKPLYYGWAAGDFLFASELKAMRSHPGFDPPVEPKALELLLRRGYVPAPLSIYRDVYKLEPGCRMTVSAQALRAVPGKPPNAPWRGKGIAIERYWSYAEVVEEGLRDPIADEDQAVEALEEALATSIRGQSVADVPVGAFLSGGIDSSIVVGFWQKYSASPVKTYTIGFEDPRFDEADAARAVAEHFGTDHHEQVVTVAEARDVIPHLPRMYDEPFGDSSQIPTHLVSRFAREHVTVALSGDGGDELFGGYNRHVQAVALWEKANRVPCAMRSPLGSLAGAIPPEAWNALAARLLGGPRPPHFGQKVQRALRSAGHSSDLEDFYRSFVDEWWKLRSPASEDLIEGCALPPLATEAPPSTTLMYWDAVSYLPDDILCKVDRAAMSVSLETRVPFLDHRFAAVAARIPAQFNVRGGKGKRTLRKLLFREAPRELFERPKAGFAVPVGDWIRGPLRDWAEALIGASELEKHGLLDPRLVRLRWQRHLAGRDETAALWPVLMFQAWLQESRNCTASTAGSIAAPADRVLVA